MKGDMYGHNNEDMEDDEESVGDEDVEDEDEDVENEDEEEVGDEDFEVEEEVSLSEGDEMDDEEEDEPDGIDENRTYKRKLESGTSENKAKKSRLSDAALTKLPTAKELNQLRETENLFHSNLFRLQIEELLKEMKPKAKYETLVKKWIEDLTKTLLSMKTSKKYILSDSKWLKKLGVEVPVLDRPSGVSVEKDQNTTKCYPIVKPTAVNVIGSYASGCFLGPNIQVDVKVEMPKECFNKDDEINFKYHQKRAVYLSYIAHVLKKSNIAQEITFSQDHSSNCLNPILEVKPSGKLAKVAIVKIFVAPDSRTFKLNRFLPSKSKISANWYFNSEDKVNAASPHYNSSVLQDLTMNVNEEFRTKLISSHPNIRDGISLLKVWLRQRQLDQGHGCFSGYIVSMYVVYLLQARRLNNLMSSYQVARNVWNNLALSDWTKDGITLSQTVVQNQPPLAEFHQHFEVVFIDCTGFLNLCANVNKEIFLRVKQESALAVTCLDNPNINSFQALFMTPKPFHLECDHIVRFPESTLCKLATLLSPADKQMDYAGQVHPQALTLILDSLRPSLANRVSLINVQLPPVERWPITSQPPTGARPLALGLVLDPEHAFGILEKGPEANAEQAEEFRKYWGEKCELRRFQDGSISEVLVWEKPGATMSRKRIVTRAIVAYILHTKLGLEGDEFAYLADQFERVLESPLLKLSDFEYGTGEEASIKTIKAFDSLAKQLRLLPDLPLDVSTIQGSSSVFRYADVFPPLPSAPWYKNMDLCQEERDGENCVVLVEKVAGTVPRWVKPVEGVIQLGMSSKWPDNLEAIRRIQAAFYVSIGKQLTERHGLTTQAHSDFVDVSKGGYVFRLRIGNQKEVALLKKVTSLDGVTKFRNTEQSIEIERNVVHLPKITGALHGLHQRHAAYGPTCCLAKRWLRSQLLDDCHIPDVCVELLVASLFLCPQPFTVPNQPQTAFFRFLHMVATTNWNAECIVLDFNSELKKDDIRKIEKAFNGNRSSLPALFIATPFDHGGSVWTKASPTLQILIRVAQLATAALDILGTWFFPSAKTSVDVSQLFVPATDVYDAVIQLKPSLNPRRHQAASPDARQRPLVVAAYEHRKGEKIPVVGFSPVQSFLGQLRVSYGDCALFFHDTYGGNVIGVLWKPSIRDTKDFKVSHVNCHKLVSPATLGINLDAVIEDFYVIGDGLVTNIATKKVEESL